MNRENEIKQALQSSFQVKHLTVIDESHRHSKGNIGSHFLIYLVSDDFQNVGRIDRERKVTEILSDHFSKGLHALSCKLYSVNEWEKKESEIKPSPPCHSKKNNF